MVVDEQITTYFNLYFLMGKRKTRKITITASEKMDLRVLCKGETEYYVRGKEKDYGRASRGDRKATASSPARPWCACHPFRAIPVSEKYELYLSSV